MENLTKEFFIDRYKELGLVLWEWWETGGKDATTIERLDWAVKFVMTKKEKNGHAS